LDTEDVVVGREHVESLVRGTGRNSLDSDLGVINTREVAGTGWLVFFWLEREGVRVDTWHWGARVVNEWLHLVEVLTLLFLEAVLAVEDELEGVQKTGGVFGPLGAIGDNHWGTGEGGGNERVRGDVLGDVGRNSDGGASEVPQVRTFIKAEDEFLDWVVVRQALLDFLARGDGVGTGVLDLFDEVFVALLSEPTALFGVEVDVVSPDLQGVLVDGGFEFGRQIEVEADLVVLEGDQWKRQTWVAVEEEQEWQVNGLARGDGRGHLTVVGLLSFIEVKLRVQTPPLLVVLVDTLTTNGQFNILDGALGEPGIGIDALGLHFDVHVGDEITVASDGDGNATAVTGGAVDGLFDVFHSEVRVTLVHGLEESDFWVARKIDILGTVRDELHETTGHCESFVLYTEKIISRKNSV